MRTRAGQHVVDVARAILADVSAGGTVDVWTLAWARFIVASNPTKTPCLEFVGALSPGGYGVVKLKAGTQRVHRLAYCEANGVELESIRGKVVRHSCDNPPCFNPEHLLLGSHADNVRDMYERGRQNRPKGTQNGRAKLTDQQVREIRGSSEPQRSLARRFGVAPSTVCKARHSTWRALA